MFGMTRHAGPILVLLAVLAMFAARQDVARRADVLLEGEARARETIGALAQACRGALEKGRKLPSLREVSLSSAMDLAALPGLGSDELSYASDVWYVFGLASHPHRDDASGAMVPGFVLRAWPARYGVTGDLEYQISDDGQLWAGQNRAGRSGTTYAFPPPFPEPGLGLRGVPWWPIEASAHK